MRDPIHDLENLGPEGNAVPALPPSEIRRRGDRLRRRHQALTAVGAAVAVAAVATTGAAVGGAFQRAEGPGPAQTPTGQSSEPTPSPTGPAPAGDDDDIPDDFPLDVDHLDLTGDGGEFEGPAPDVREFTVNPCGQHVWTVPARDRLAFFSSGPEFNDYRELRTFADADEAVAQMESIRSMLDACPSEELEGEPHEGGGTLTWARYDADTGYDTTTFGSFREMALGGDLVQVTRVGRAVLFTLRYAEYDEISLERTVPDTTELTGRIAPSMCLFTEAGCGGDAEPATTISDGNLMTAADLAPMPEAEAWEQREPLAVPTLACQPAWLTSLEPEAMVSREFRITEPGSGTETHRVNEAVLEFGDAAAARSAYATVRGWIADCSDLVQPILVLGEPAIIRGDDVTEPDVPADGVAMREVWLPAPEVCEECDAAWFDHQAVALIGNRLVLVSHGEVAGPLSPGADDVDDTEGEQAWRDRVHTTLGAAVARATP